ncbi:MAG: FtsW/RodA/SpoVE family cell cycle protein [Eubacterium sp.]|nr:FtsW/RodA/SpoVE family cell cycle protein [Eubacterium sp.]
MDILKSITDSFSSIGMLFEHILSNGPTVGDLYTTVARWIFVILALYILTRAIRSLLSTRIPHEIWGYITLPDGDAKPVAHWENVLGRSKNVDIHIDYPTVSRSHGTLVRDEDENWFYNDLGSKGGSLVNGVPVTESTPVKIGDTITMGGVDCVLLPTSLEEQRYNKNAREHLTRTFTPWKSLIALTIFQVMLVIQLMIAENGQLPSSVPVCFAVFTAMMWAYSIFIRAVGSTAFEIESIAFFLSTLGLAVCATSVPAEMTKQLITIALGLCLFLGMCWYLRDLDRAMKIRKLLVIGSVILLMINLLLGTNKYGATNWVSLGGFTFQPSELVKIAYIFVGTATLDELFEKRNLTLFLGFSIFCLGCLALMGDFGTASIFFVTFLVISFLRSGDFSKLFLLVGAALAGIVMIIRFKPYILGRFQTWMHAWDFPDAGGYQQTRTMSAGASGGLVGMGAGEGWLHNIAAADTDLVFGILSEEWGLIIAVLAVMSIVTLGIFAFRSIKAARSAFYTIAACAATTLFIFQTMLNVFGAVDIFPLTGVTFPFVSNGGTSMIVSWGLLAFLKAADTRSNASIAVRKAKLKGDEW